MASDPKPAAEAVRVSAVQHRCSGCGHRWEGALKGAELCGDCWRKGQTAILGAEAVRASAPLTNWEREARCLLWMNHGCPFIALYGDDGEMQCANGRHRPLDFKREPWDVLETELQRVIGREIALGVSPRREVRDEHRRDDVDVDSHAVPSGVGRETAVEVAPVEALRQALEDALIVTRNYYAQAISRAELERHQDQWRQVLKDTSVAQLDAREGVD